MSRPESGCAACSSTSHTVRSCETQEAVAYWRRRAVKLRTMPGSYTEAADKCDARAAAIARRLSGAQAPVTQGSPRLQGRAAFVKEPKNEKPFDMAPIDDDLAELERIAPLEGRKHNSRGRPTR